MANIYKNAFFAGTTTNTVTVYTAPSNARGIINNIQITSESGDKVVKASITDNSASTTQQIAYASITGPTICNLAKGPIILEENDSILLETNNTTAVTGVLSILEISREDQNG